MSLPDADSPKPRFSELFAYHLRVGTRPPGKARQPGEAWRPKEFADLLGVSDRTVRYWMSGEALPSDLNSIERLLFGNDMSASREERLALRDSLVTSQRLAKTAGGSKEDSVQQSSEPDRDAASMKREFVERGWDLVIPNTVDRELSASR